jgi:RNA polymerase sigma-70 factor (ECF subfamily)
VAATNSGLQRARQTVQGHAERAPGGTATPPTQEERAVLQAFIAAHQGTDPSASLALLCQDVRVTMPPRPLCYEGVASVAPLIAGAAEMGEWRLVPAWANRQPAAVSYLRRPNDRELRAFKIDVLRVRDNHIQEITTFEGRLVELFGLPAVLV